MYYRSGFNILNKIFKFEKIRLPLKIKNYILSLLSKFCRYEEEETKIRPQLLIGKDVSFFLTQVPDKLIYRINKSSDCNAIEKILKSLIPLSNLGWCTYIDFKEKKIEYGLFRQIDTLTIEDFRKIIFGYSYPAAEIADRALIYFNFENSSSFSVCGINGTKELISYDFISQVDNDNYFSVFFERYYTGEKLLHDIKEFWNKYEILLRKNVHGCICVVVDSKIKIADEFSKGIWLDDPIKLVEDVVKYKRSSDYHDLMELEYNTELTLKCINNDGISIFDEKGNLIAYNVFVKSKESTNHAGGARRRAAEWICEVKPRGCLAVYFQSQDGETFFKEI